MANQYNSKVVLSNGTVLIDLTADTVDAAHLLKDYTAHNKAGAAITGSCTYDADTQDATAAVGEILATKTAYARGSKLTGTMTNNGAVSGTISNKTVPYVIPQGYHDGSGSVTLDADSLAALVPANIREGVTILSVEGTMSGSEDVHAQSKTATPSWSQQTISPDTGYNYLSSVTVASIPISYTDNSAGGVTVTIG